MLVEQIFSWVKTRNRENAARLARFINGVVKGQEIYSTHKWSRKGTSRNERMAVKS